MNKFITGCYLLYLTLFRSGVCDSAAAVSRRVATVDANDSLKRDASPIAGLTSVHDGVPTPQSKIGRRIKIFMVAFLGTIIPIAGVIMYFAYERIVRHEHLKLACTQAIVGEALRRYGLYNRDRILTDIKKEFLPLFEARLKEENGVATHNMPAKLIQTYPSCPELEKGDITKIKAIIEKLVSDTELSIKVSQLLPVQSGFYDAVLGKKESPRSEESLKEATLINDKNVDFDDLYDDDIADKFLAGIAERVNTLVMEMVEPEKLLKDKPVDERGDAKTLEPYHVREQIVKTMKNYYLSDLDFANEKDAEKRGTIIHIF